jgi:hypothetical protein
MNRIEKLRSNIETLKDGLALDWSDLALPVTDEQRIEIEKHLEWCLTEMSWCLAEMKDSLSGSEKRVQARMQPFRRFAARIVNAPRAEQFNARRNLTFENLGWRP